MPKGLLLVVFSPLTGRSDVFVEEASVVIGRGEQCKIKLDGMSVEREHARIVRTGEQYAIEDLKSRSGTKVNGAPISRHELKVGDEIEIGNYLLRVEEGTRQYGFLSGKAPKKGPADAPAPAPAAPAPRGARPPAIDRDLELDASDLPFVSRLVGDFGDPSRSGRADKPAKKPVLAGGLIGGDEASSALVSPPADAGLSDRIKNVLIGDAESQLIIPEINLEGPDGARLEGEAGDGPETHHEPGPDSQLIGEEPPAPPPPPKAGGPPPGLGILAGLDSSAPPPKAPPVFAQGPVGPGPQAGQAGPGGPFRPLPGMPGGVFGAGAQHAQPPQPPGTVGPPASPLGVPGFGGWPGGGQPPGVGPAVPGSPGLRPLVRPGGFPVPPSFRPSGPAAPPPESAAMPPFQSQVAAPQGSPGAGVVDLFGATQKPPQGTGEPTWGRDGVGSYDLLEFMDVDAKALQLGGLENLKRWVTLRQKAFDPKAREFGVPQPRGITLLGLPGCGKKHITKAFAHIWGFRMARLKLELLMSEALESWLQILSMNLQQVERSAPLVLLVDDADRLVNLLNQSHLPGLPVAYRLINTVVTWLKQKSCQVFVSITGTNLAAIHPDLLRRGQAVDDVFFVDLPTPRERAQIWQLVLTQKGRKAGAYDIPALVTASEGYSGAELDRAVSFGLYEAYSENRELTSGDIFRCLSMGKELSELREKAPLFAAHAGQPEDAAGAQNVRAMRPRVPGRPEGGQ
ncbi:MAG: FHA domain-containing protein [Candidatus Riflebacteria bacterium]|nr:FHA domain-containing protein [Candidatus Riflebacteria bacterium]